ncbi:hypothetical protein H5410_022212 [Solanum commersonii]|uniref:DUF4283 domain-containing protein n=1 Tax=Solanum commersonii TaxID=4109 RepID=A0A9J5ZDB4_SOLCO|nr:hypothetical protein H5410_022212 [Solanum commersonii]
MDNSAASQPPVADSNDGPSQVSLGKVNYVELVKDSTPHRRNHGAVPPIQMKQIQYVERVPRIIWKGEEVNRMNVLENLQFAVIGKFSCGWPELDDLKVQIPKQLHIKGDCTIDLLSNRHLLIILSQMEDFINIMSKNTYYIIAKDGYAYQMWPLIYDAKFKPEEETTQAMSWIYFLQLLPTFYGKETLFSLASVVGKPVDLIANLPEWVEIEVISPGKQSTRIEKIKIQYDFLTKYCRTCKLQGHNEEECRTIHPELKYAREQEVQEEGELP